jgi:hypothetical protein
MAKGSIFILVADLESWHWIAQPIKKELKNKHPPSHLSFLWTRAI